MLIICSTIISVGYTPHFEYRLIMAPKLYYVTPSPPVRAVLMTADALGLELDLEVVDTLKGENLKPEYIKV